METTRLSSKGQVILPKSIRDARHWAPGAEFEIENRFTHQCSKSGSKKMPNSCFSATLVLL